MKRIIITVALLAVCALPALAEPIFPEGWSTDLDQQFIRHGRQFYLINAYPFGMSLDAHPAAESVELIDLFLSQTESDDVEAVTGKHPFELLNSYGEFGDLGFFGGVAVVGTTMEYLTLKRDGAPAEQLEKSRARVVRAAEALHIFYVVTGGNGLVARGIRRLEPEDPADPPLPGDLPEVIELFDENGAPLRPVKDNGTFRWDNSGGILPADEWMWVDSCSKDQLVGQVLALTSLYDAMNEDPDIDQSLVERLQADALGTAKMLMTMRDISELEGANGTGEYDLIIMDADGRPTYHHDINPKSLEKNYLPHDTQNFNRFNLLMTLGIMTGLYHVTGDPEIEEYLYDELLDDRGYLEMVTRSIDDGAIDYIYLQSATNFDNPDMTGVAMWLMLYNETDPEVIDVVREYFENGWWNRPDESHTARLAKQPLWHAIYLTLTDRGEQPDLIGELRDLLLGFELGPYWNERRENCDAAEIEAGVCLAVDDITELTIDPNSPPGELMATEALDPSIRPPSNFDARSNPFTVNGGGGLRLNPGGDLQSAYWIARYMQTKPTGESNISRFARSHIKIGGTVSSPDPIDNDQEDDGSSDESSGCSCSLTGHPAPGDFLPTAALLILFIIIRRRQKLVTQDN